MNNRHVTNHDNGAHHSDHDHHVVPVRVYFAVWVALLVGLILTYAAAQVHLGGVLNNVVALTIAVAKAALVVLFFMGSYYGTRLVKVWSAIGFVWLLLMAGILADYASRSWVQAPAWDAGSPTREVRPMP
jgi:cytochrome c oxidase subunit 4